MADLVGFLIEHGPALMRGAGITVAVTLIGITAGLGLATLLAAALLRAGSFIRRILRGYINLFRDTPFIVQLFFIFFGLPALGLQFNAFSAAVVAIALNFSAYAAEMIRGSIESLPPGQAAAGRALGMSERQIFLSLQLPQALANSFAALSSQAVLALLDTAVVSQIALADLAFQGDMIQSRTFLAFETYATVTLIYLGLSLGLRALLHRASRGLRQRSA